MTKDFERLEKMIAHPALAAKRELAEERNELVKLLGQIPNVPPRAGSREYAAYLQTQKEVQALKEKISKKHDELMEILKNEEKISREIQGKNS